MQGDTRPPQFDDALDWHGATEWLRWQLADVDVPGLRLDAPLEVRQPQAHAAGSATEAQSHRGTTGSATEAQRHRGTTGSATEAQRHKGTAGSATEAQNHRGTTGSATGAQSHRGTAGSATETQRHRGTAGSATEAQRHRGATGSATEAQSHRGTTGSAAEAPHDLVVRFGGADLALSVARHADADTTRALARTADWHTALHPHYPLAPRVFALCTDTSVLGRAFFVAEHRRGVAVSTREPIALHAEPGRRQALGVALVEAMADLHRLDGEAAPFAPFRSEPGALDRALQHALDLWMPRRGQVPDLDSVALWLRAYEPADSLEPTVVHRAFGLTALRLDPLEPERIVAVLDWEHAAVGDPLSDLGTLLASWVAVDADEPQATGLVTAEPGYPSRDDLAAHYARRTGRPLDGLTFHEVLALFRRAVALVSDEASPRQRAAAARLAAEARARTAG